MRTKLLQQGLLMMMMGVASLAARGQGAQAPLRAPEVPASLAVPDGASVAAQFSATGVQIYRCDAAPDGKAYQWTLVAPEASLHDAQGAVAGRHYSGPTWEAKDGSAITGKVLARAPAPDPADVAWLLLAATPVHEGETLGKVRYVQRLNTHGGVAPAASCAPANRGAELRVAYTADYWFYAPR